MKNVLSLDLVPAKNKAWLTTEDAARLSGFSRPFIIALLDGPLYTGQVTRTDKGHQRVNRMTPSVSIPK